MISPLLLLFFVNTPFNQLQYLAVWKVIMQGKLFQRCTHLLYCSVLSLGGNVNTRWMSKPDMGSIFHIKNQWNILVIGNNYVKYQNFQNLMVLTSWDTKWTLMHIFLFTNSAQRELRELITRRVDTTAINFPFIITLTVCIKSSVIMQQMLENKWMLQMLKENKYNMSES